MTDADSLFRVPETRSSRRHSIIGIELPTLSFKRSRRKRKQCDDTLSLKSFESISSAGSVSKQKKKRRKSLIRVSSLANILSPGRHTKKTDDEFQKSVNFKVPSSPTQSRHNVTPYKAPLPSPAKRRLVQTWTDMMANGGYAPSKLSQQDIKRQEAIYELYQGENDIIDDLTIVKKTYHDSMEKLQLLSSGELRQIFGPIDALIPVHEELVQRLLQQRSADGTSQDVGLQLVEWIPKLEEYVPFCANQFFAKALFDEKKNDPAVDDFLQRCQESPFSRKLDLWSLLDGARSRFMKYPLLLRTIQKFTSCEAKDFHHLNQAIKLSEKVIAEADKKTGEAKCRYYMARISYLYDDQKHPSIEESSSLICNGTLKNTKNNKLHVILFDRVLLVTRPVTQNSQQYFRVFQNPIPVEELVVEDLVDGEVRMGSFRSAFGQGQPAKNVIRLSFKDTSRGQSHTLLANDQHDKRQWLQCLKLVLPRSNSLSP